MLAGESVPSFDVRTYACVDTVRCCSGLALGVWIVSAEADAAMQILQTVAAAVARSRIRT
ncbi:hypothetical protein CCUG62472_03580 [Mycobacteroides salmoniphilum]|uniref:Uncharacterized protein n=1 Tax=Mycobacteroides salmoniphilum TaxID=404941 RepID=A0A4R8SS29_9MYCO|nr:hypothetical protein CCUG62472_03580 [Mycobacteroides salmoniphilum]TEA02637.1 hypothetical protein CCUG60884_03774 [Mycobacteroides salmoniphilum]